MCKASIEAGKVRNAQEKDRTILGTSPYGFPQLMRTQDMGDGCVTCPKIGQSMHFVNVPLELQETMGVPGRFVAAFVEEEDDVPDTIFYEGRQIDLMALAQYSQGQVDLVKKVHVTMVSVMSPEERQKMIDIINGTSPTSNSRAARSEQAVATA